MRELLPYIKIARPDHWFKNIFILPGVVFAILLSDELPNLWILHLFIVIVSTCFIASANYVINEWLDREFDKYHPIKKNRPSVGSHLVASYVYLEYVILAVLGLGLAVMIGVNFLICASLLLIMGLVYNVPPLRTKERVYLDVLSESINNPLRFLMGWFVIETHYMPPVSILLAYWMGGAFLMGIKRFAEFRYIGNPVQAGLYRRSFNYYTESSLLISSFFYALCCAFFLGIFLIKYRIEYLLILPFLSLLFAWYLRMGLAADSSVQNPEKLYRDRPFVTYVGMLSCLFVFLTFVDIPWLHFFLSQSLLKW